MLAYFSWRPQPFWRGYGTVTTSSNRRHSLSSKIKPWINLVGNAIAPIGVDQKLRRTKIKLEPGQSQASTWMPKRLRNEE